MADKRDTVTFTSIQKSYPPGEKLAISYGLHSELKSSRRDWVGLFRVGWTSSRDYYTFEWAPTPQDNLGQVTFAGRRLPPEDGHFYQVCYVTSDGRVRGASPPFQFLSNSLPCCLDDLELVEVTEDSIMVLQPKASSERNLEEELTSVNASMKVLEVQHKEVSDKLEAVANESLQKNEQLQERDAQIAELQRQLQAKRESEQRLMDKLEKERAQNHELNAAKTDDETQLGILRQQIADREAEVNSSRVEITALKAEHDDIKGQLQIKTSQAEDLTKLASARGEEKEQVAEELAQATKQLMDMKGVHADQLQQLAAKQAETETMILEMKARDTELVQLRNENERLQGEVGRLQQEVAIAQQNIAELMGAGPNALVVNQPVQTEQPVQEPPTQSEPKETVDKAIYDALLQAYENMEDYYRSALKDNDKLNKQVQETKTKNEELKARVEQCREAYESLAKENHELRSRKGHSHAENEALEARIAELEDENTQMNVSCETAIEELSTRKAELKQKNEQIAEIEATLQQLQYDFEQFQDKHDKVVQDKTAMLDEQQALLDEKLEELVAVRVANTALEKEKGKCEQTIAQLRAQLDSLKAAAKPNRQCPVCNTTFPGRISQRDFETHVQGHFQQ